MTSIIFALPAPIAIKGSALGCKVNCETKSGISVSVQFPSAQLGSPFLENWFFENHSDVKLHPIGQGLRLSDLEIEEALVFALLVRTNHEAHSAQEGLSVLIDELEHSFKNLQSIFEVDFLQVRDPGFDLVARRTTQTKFQIIEGSEGFPASEPESHLTVDVAIHTSHFIRGDAVGIADLIPAFRDAFGGMRGFLYWRFCLSQARKSFLMADFSLSSYWSAHALESSIRGPTARMGESLGRGRNFRTLLSDITQLGIIGAQEAEEINTFRNNVVHNATRPTALEAENFYKRCEELIAAFLASRD